MQNLLVFFLIENRTKQRETKRKDRIRKAKPELFKLNESHLKRTNVCQNKPLKFMPLPKLPSSPRGFSGCSSIPAGPSAGPERSCAMQISGALCRCGAVQTWSPTIFPFLLPALSPPFPPTLPRGCHTGRLPPGHPGVQRPREPQRQPVVTWPKGWVGMTEGLRGPGPGAASTTAQPMYLVRGGLIFFLFC